MKKLLLFIAVAAGGFLPHTGFTQAPPMGSTQNYVLFTSAGAVGNTGVSHITGNIGTQLGAVTAFGNVDGVMHIADPAATTAGIDLALLYTAVSTTVTTATHAAVLGTGEVLSPGVYQIAAAGSVAGTLTLDAGGDATALFIFKVGGAFTTGAGTEVILVNNAQACNIFWVAEGAIGMAAGTTMKGTLIAHNAAISMAAGGKLEGRMFSTAGAVAIDGTTARLPLGCGLPVLTGPEAPTLAEVECFALFTANGAITNTGVTVLIGDVGSNMGATSGFVAGDVSGTIHLIPDAATAASAADLALVLAQLNALPVDIELLFPGAVGNKLVLTPHVYLLDAATVISDSLFLNAQGNADAVFVFSLAGTLTTGSGTTVVLQNGAQAKNVFWIVNGNVTLGANTKFSGILVADEGTIDLAMDVELNGRALTTGGIFTTNKTKATIPTMCSTVDVISPDGANDIAVFPNPFDTYIHIDLYDASMVNTVQVSLYNASGELVLNQVLTGTFSRIETANLPTGIYLYRVFDRTGVLRKGQLVAN